MEWSMGRAMAERDVRSVGRARRCLSVAVGGRIRVLWNMKRGEWNVPAIDECSNTSFTTVPFGIRGEIAMVGTRIPRRSKLKPVEDLMPSGLGRPVGGGTWS